MKNFRMVGIVAVASLTLLSGCASYLTARPPVIEDKVGISGHETVGTLATSPDYRVVYVRLQPEAKLCAEAPADAAAQFASSFAASLSTPLASGKELGVEAKVGLAVAMKQLFKRSQGVQFYRDGVFALCNLYLNQAISESEYLAELKALRKDAAELIKQEIPRLDKISVDPIVVPVAPQTAASAAAAALVPEATASKK